MYTQSRLLYISLLATLLMESVSLVVLLLVWTGKAADERKETSRLFQTLSEVVNQNSLRIDANTEALLKYMQRTTIYLDKLQRDNPQIKVPKAAENRPLGAPLPTEKELERPKYEHPKADQPRPTPQIITKYKARPKPKPTPEPWYHNLFNPKSTR